jgi:hypothetical protein
MFTPIVIEQIANEILLELGYRRDAGQEARTLYVYVSSDYEYAIAPAGQHIGMWRNETGIDSTYCLADTRTVLLREIGSNVR